MRVCAIFAKEARAYLAHRPTHACLVVVVGHLEHFALHLEWQLLVRTAHLLQTMCKHARLAFVALACLITLAECSFILGVHHGTNSTVSHQILLRPVRNLITGIVALTQADRLVLIELCILS